MASIGGVSSSNMSSIYGSRNVISGLASGMDTEGMIENAVSGIKARITSLGKKRTTWEWKQSAYQGVIDKLAQFANKYTSYSSTTNLSSASFFNKAVSTTTSGSNASKVSATGKTNSEVLMNAVKSLATAARGVSTGGAINAGKSEYATIEAGESVDLAASMKLSEVSGSLTINYGGKSVDLSFEDHEVYETTEKFAEAISEKLKEKKITLSNGDTVTADKLIEVDVDADTNKISFSDKSTGGNTVAIGGASGKLADTLGLKDAYSEKPESFTVDESKLSKEANVGEYISGKTMSFTLDGVTKKIQLPEMKKDASGNSVALTPEEYTDALQKELNSVFGDGKIVVSNLDKKTDASGNDISDTLKLNFTVGAKGSSLVIAGDAGETLKIGKEATSYRNMGDTLGSIMDPQKGNYIIVDATKVTEKDGKSYDKDGNEVIKETINNKDEYVRVAKDGKAQKEYDLIINDVKVGTYNRDTSLDTVVSNINNNTEAGVNVTYSKTTGNFTFTAKETGEANGIKLNEGFAQDLFGSLGVQKKNDDGTPMVDGNNNPVYETELRGTDAVFNVSINGESMDMKRSTNTFDIDGLSLTLKDTFNADKYKTDGTLDTDAVAAEDKVSFTTKSDTEKIIGAIKSMVEDYNVMMKEIKTQYGSMPLQKANGSKYEPLTDEDKNSMSEDAVKAYEENARQGLLFGDTDLSSLYNKMRGIFSSNGSDGNFLRSIGIDTEYSNADGTTVKLDEEKLKAALENNPDAVKDAFTKTKDGGASTNGVMFNLKTQLDNYAGTMGATKGILIEKAGSKYAPTSLLQNSMKEITDDIDKEIERWQVKLSDSIDRYTGQFSRLEQLIAQMNSQSSALMGMMGGG